MTSKIGIFGASGMAREAVDIADALNLKTVIIAKDELEKSEYEGNDDVITEDEIDSICDISFVIAIGNTHIRRIIAEKYGEKLNFTNLIHPSASFGRGQKNIIDGKKGIIMAAGTRLTNNVNVGNFVIFNLNVTVSHDTSIGDYVTLSPQGCVLGNTQIGEGAWIGAGAVINQGRPDEPIKIGDFTTIGSGAIVTKDCLNPVVYVGVPAREI